MIIDYCILFYFELQVTLIEGQFYKTKLALKRMNVQRKIRHLGTVPDRNE